MRSFLADKDSLSLDTRTLARQVALSLLLLLAVLPPIHLSLKVYRADKIIRNDRSTERYSRALKYNPENATYWWYRGSLYHYSVEATDIPRAIQDYEKALSLNPRLGQVWLDLAGCYESEGEFSKAEQAIENALRVRRFSPLAHWQAGNFYLRRGNLAKMYESFKLASEYDPSKLGIAMETAWKADADHKGILQKLIPDSLQANLRYMDFLLGRDEPELARAAWQRSLKNEIPADFKYSVSSSFGYIDRLLAKNRFADAKKVWDEALQKAGTGIPVSSCFGYVDGLLAKGRFADAQQVWDEALQKSGTGLRDTRPRFGSENAAKLSAQTNLLWNGSFENEIQRAGFDWRYANRTDVQFHVDVNHRLEGLKSLKVTFTGSNASLSDPYQIIPIPVPGHYRLEFYLRTERLTTDQTPYLAIQGYPNAQGASLRTGFFPSSNDWQKLSFGFSVQVDCRAIQLNLRRDTSSKFDNQIKGSLWLDGVSIHYAGPSDTGNGDGGVKVQSPN